LQKSDLHNAVVQTVAGQNQNT